MDGTVIPAKAGIQAGTSWVMLSNDGGHDAFRPTWYQMCGVPPGLLCVNDKEPGKGLAGLHSP